MENRKKFYANGAWGDDNLAQRYAHVCGALVAFKLGILDEQDLDVAIKNAFVSKVFVSVGVKNAYSKAFTLNPNLWGNLSPLYKELSTKGELDFPNKYPFNGKGFNYMNICELGAYVKNREKVFKKQGIYTPITIEHVVPGKVYVPEVINLFERSNFGLTEFEQIFNSVSICLVTANENKKLDAVRESDGKGVRSRMPLDKNGGEVDYTQYPFARYQRAGVEIYNLSYKPHIGIEAFMKDKVDNGSDRYRINQNNDMELESCSNGSNWGQIRIFKNEHILGLRLSDNMKDVEIYTDQNVYVMDSCGNINKKQKKKNQP